MFTDVVFVGIVESVDYRGFGGPFVLVDGFPQPVDVLVSVEFQHVEHVHDELVLGDVQLKGV